ncbi:MAG: AAA family ATPase [Desulfosudaceae bacterium]
MNPIQSALAAHASLIYVTSPDEARVIADVEKISLKTGQRLWMYTATKGLWVALPPEYGSAVFTHESPTPSLRDPIAMLGYLQDLHVPAFGAIFVLLDFHEWLRDGIVRRHLRDLIQPLKEKNSAILIISPVTVQMPELAQDIRLIAYAPPSFDDLERHLLSSPCREACQAAGLNLNDAAQKEVIIEAGRGLTLHQFEQCLFGVLARGDTKPRQLSSAMLAEKKQLLQQSGLLEVIDSRHPSDVGGLAAIKAWFHKRRRGFSQKARKAGLPPPKGILLLGVPGSGKSLTARALTAIWSLPLLRLDTGRLFSGQVGASEERVRQALASAEAMSPCVLWIDELDKAMAGLGSSSDSDAGTAARVFATLATWMQEKTAPVFLMATANALDTLPPELLRKGRWDEIFFVDLPGLGDRQEILTIHLRKRGLPPEDYDVRLLAEFCQGYSGAEIEQAIISGLYDAFAEDRGLTTGDVLRGLEEQVPLSRTMAEEITALRQWAAGRARPAAQDDIERRREQWQQRRKPPVRALHQQ